MRPTIPTLAELDALPVVYRLTIPPAYRDHMEHMNIRWYMHIYDDAGDEMYKLWGEDQAYYAEYQAGGMDLEHHIHYLNEVRIGDVVALRVRLLSRSAKRLHYVMFMVNETRGLLSSTFECVHSHIDKRTRRTSPYPAILTERMDALLAAHQQLTWTPPVSGSMSA